MMKIIPLLFFLSFSVSGQNYTSYFTGNPVDTVTAAAGGVCMMGGATEDDNAMKWFLQRANGGNVLVLRASGSNGYNGYMFNLGVPVRSVETIVCHNASASNEPYLHQKIAQAEAIWFAGGDQWDYVRYWRNTPVDSLINIALHQRNIVIGGTSAGMAILGKYYFTAQAGTVTSAVALANPYNSKVRVDSTRFLTVDNLQEVITDTHFDNPDRKGRLVVFLARIFTDYQKFARGIACDEYTAVCIDTSGIARVFGGYPSYDDNAYFLQHNCELTSPAPENCTAGNPLTWDLGGQALKVYRLKGNSTGTNTFDLNDWKTGTGGTWMNWGVANGVLTEQPGIAINCPALTAPDPLPRNGINIFPNPASDKVIITSEDGCLYGFRFTLFTLLGQEVPVIITQLSERKTEIRFREPGEGCYLLRMDDGAGRFFYRTIFRIFSVRK